MSDDTSQPIRLCEWVKLVYLKYDTMKNLFCLLFSSLVCVSTFSQNLVLNPSFEDTLNDCSTTNYHICKDWINPNGGSADYFNPYADVMDCIGGAWKTPNSFFGFQNAFEGESFLGLVLYQPFASDVKEYGQGFLSQPLIANQTYYVSMFVNMIDSSSFSTCEIEMAFTDQLIYTSSGGSMNLSNKVQFDISDVDTIDWKLLTGTYIANGGEQYLYIGSNTPNSDLTCIQITNIGENITNAAYYAIDNVYVSDKPLTTNEQSEEQIQIFPNIMSDFVTIKNQTLNEKCSITDLNGRILISEKLSKKTTQIDLKNLPNGYYLLNLERSGKIFKIIIHH